MFFGFEMIHPNTYTLPHMAHVIIEERLNHKEPTPILKFKTQNTQTDIGGLIKDGVAKNIIPFSEKKIEKVKTSIGGDCPKNSTFSNYSEFERCQK